MLNSNTHFFNVFKRKEGMQFLLLVIGLALFDVKEFEKLHTNKCISMWKVEKKNYIMCAINMQVIMSHNCGFENL